MRSLQDLHFAREAEGRDSGSSHVYDSVNIDLGGVLWDDVLGGLRDG